ncbi:hypoxanthine phosphoribosyltransferase [bacterium]|nr:hypoxanthine phosphoribosyltransferase [bacterium]MBU1650688.1 hypoxanthine phosphoribosyltransferase [bacterium]
MVQLAKDPLISEFDIKVRLQDLVLDIARDLKQHELTIIGILRGSFMFTADLVRLLYTNDMHPLIDFVYVTSYAGSESTGEMKLLKEPSLDVRDKWVLVVDDILDTGRTMHYAVNYLKDRGAAQVRSCVLLDKPTRRIVDIHSDYVGFTIDDIFVVGYGLDYNGRFRDLPYIGMMDEPVE